MKEKIIIAILEIEEEMEMTEDKIKLKYLKRKHTQLNNQLKKLEKEMY